MSEYQENQQNNPQQEQKGPQQGGQHDPYQTTAGNSSWQPGQRYQGNERQHTQWSNGTYGANQYQNPYGYHQQNQQRAAQEEYRWNFAEYSNAKQSHELKKKRRGLKVFTGVICSIFALAVIGFAGYGIYDIFQGSVPTADDSAASVAPGASSGQEIAGIDIKEIPSTAESLSSDGILTTKQIAAKVRPSVVGIVAYGYSSAGAAQLPFFGQQGTQIETAEGSGIIMSEDGYIITNAHVVEGAAGIKVVLNSGEEYNAELIGADSNTDLAVLKIEADNLTPAEFGDSSQLEVGEDVVAIGNPGGLEFAGSVSKGIISGVNRPIRSSDAGYTMNCIQTDAAINPGNSGGALVNCYGQVIGINSSKIASTEYEGLGFAIPIHEAKPIIDDLIANGHVTGRVKLGVNGYMIDETLARYNSLPTGFLVIEIDQGSDIASKGVIAGDIITQIDDQNVTDMTVLRDYLKNFKPGDKVTLTIFRRTSGKSDTTFEITISLMEDEGTGTTQEIVPQSVG